MNLQHAQILRLYDEPHRRYHNVFHPLEMLEMHDTGATRGLRIEGYVQPGLSWVLRDDLVEAILAHDCVYQIGMPKGWNERESLKVWGRITGRRDTLRAGIVEPLILATITHNPDDVACPLAWKPFVAHMIDLDMAPLGADADEYDRNSANLKAEFLAGGIAPEAYEVGRRAFLQQTLEQPTIFFTEQFRDALEEKARANMRRALAPGYGC